jgi:hypothetical protein
MQRKCFSLTALLLGAMILAGCGSVKIGRINSDPSRYRNQTIHVSGTVLNSVGVLNTGGYQIEDETGKIYVISRSGVPSRGSHVTVTGTVMPGAQVLGTTVGAAIREESHRVK